LNAPTDLRTEHCVLDIFIGGFLDRFSRIVLDYRRAFRQSFPNHTTFYFEHDQCKEVVSAIMTAKTRNAQCSINLIGHSWGAVTAIRAANCLAEEGIIVSKVITIDPVAHRRIRVMSKESSWINVNAAPALSNGWNGDYYATLGGKWADWPRDKATVHYWAPCHHNEFASLFEYVALHGKCALECLTETDKSKIPPHP
jgi:pimeloyl-ACP methyl ester carboxylesterase